MENQLENIAWDNTNIYSGLEDTKIEKDLITIEENIKQLKSQSVKIEELLENLDSSSESDLKQYIPQIIQFKEIELSTIIALRTIGVFASCITVADTTNSQAKKLSGRVSQISAQFGQSTKAIHVFLMRAPEKFIQELLEEEKMVQFRFSIQNDRIMKDHLLSSSEEKLITGLATDGLHAWGKLYTDLAGTIKVDYKGDQIGLAAASSVLRSGTRPDRELAYRAIDSGWDTHRESAAAILNSINGWRNELFRNRSKKKPLHYLDQSCHTSRISRKTLDTLLETTHQRIDVGRKANQLMAKTMGVEKLAPWDILQPAPLKTSMDPVPFPMAMEKIITAFSEFDPAMGEFAKMMWDKKWIDGLPTPNRSSGAFCTKFANTREPRVFLTYNGSMGDIITLAHELGHAYHNWVLKDAPYMESGYSMTLAETASVFAETLVRDYLINEAEAKNDKDGLQTILWQELVSASAFLVNIPTRFDFEKDLVERRQKEQLSADDLCTMMETAWSKWYGDTMTEPAKYFWASKLHFSISGLSFYNYPYLFGYLFSLGIYAQKETKGEGFKPLYENILIDTGKMTAENLVQKNLGLNIEEADFWNNSINIVSKAIDKYETLL